MQRHLITEHQKNTMYAVLTQCCLVLHQLLMRSSLFLALHTDSIAVCASFACPAKTQLRLTLLLSLTVLESGNRCRQHCHTCVLYIADANANA